MKANFQIFGEKNLGFISGLNKCGLARSHALSKISLRKGKNNLQVINIEFGKIAKSI